MKSNRWRERNSHHWTSNDDFAEDEVHDVAELVVEVDVQDERDRVFVRAQVESAVRLDQVHRHEHDLSTEPEGLLPEKIFAG